MADPSPPSVLLCMGSNIEPAVHLPAALRLVADRLTLVGVSRVFETLPVDVRGGALFLNAALEVTCPLTPRELKFEVLRSVEQQLGRVRTADRNAPRTIDLDICLFGDLVVTDRQCGLEIPDPEILIRAHVAIPLADLAPARRHPVTRQCLAEIAGNLDASGLRVIEELEGWPKSGSFAP